MGRLIGIDYGLKRTGIAVTDPLKIIANGLTTVETRTLFDFLKTYIQMNQVDGFVVGYPLSMKGEPTDVTSDVESFMKKLEDVFPGKEIHRIDERLSSKMAFQTMIDSGIGRMKRRNKALIDKISATIILQSYLEKISR